VESKTFPKIIIQDDPILLAKQAAEIFVDSARRLVDKRGRFVAAISGGSTPRRMHKMLAKEPYVLKIPWEKTHIFWVDERCVPANDRASNYGVAQGDILNRVPIPEAQVHFMKGRLSPEDGVQNYMKMLVNFFHIEDDAFPIFDLIFLGMGTDGHTASLFPGQKVLDEKKKMIVAVKGGDPNVNRISMTLPLLNQARHIVFLITGEEKARTVKAVLEDEDTQLPARKIRPLNGRLTWLLDCGAASLLSGDHHHDQIYG
jgi:6-phosphogluconolactonase